MESFLGVQLLRVDVRYFLKVVDGFEVAVLGTVGDDVLALVSGQGEFGGELGCGCYV